jgi:hypothetical protein
MRTAWRTRPRPGIRQRLFESANDTTHPAAMSIAVVFGRPPTCAYADMDHLKSNEAIRSREFAPRDPCRTNQR